MGKDLRTLIHWLDSRLNGSDQTPAAEPLPTNDIELQAWILSDQERTERHIAVRRAEVDAQSDGNVRIVKMVCWTALALAVIGTTLVALVLAANGGHIKVHGSRITWKTFWIVSGTGLGTLATAIFSAVKWGRKLLTAMKIMRKKPDTKALPPP